jgi:hypothetical protein
MKISMRKSGEGNQATWTIYVRDENAEDSLKTQEEIGRIYYSEERGKTLGKETGVWITEVQFSEVFGIKPNWEYSSTPKEAKALVEQCVFKGTCEWQELSELQRNQIGLLRYCDLLLKVVSGAVSESFNPEQSKVLVRYTEELSGWFDILAEYGQECFVCHDRYEEPDYVDLGLESSLDAILYRANRYSCEYRIIEGLVEKIRERARKCNYDKELNRGYYDYKARQSQGAVESAKTQEAD